MLHAFASMYLPWRFKGGKDPFSLRDVSWARGDGSDVECYLGRRRTRRRFMLCDYVLPEKAIVGERGYVGRVLPFATLVSVVSGGWGRRVVVGGVL